MRVPSIFIDNFDEITFEHRNQSYGAYYLRTHQSEYSIKGLLCAMAVIAFIFIAPSIYAYFRPTIIPVEECYDVILLSDPRPKTETVKPARPAIAKPAAARAQMQNVAPIVVVDHKDVVEVNLPTNATLQNVETGSSPVAGTGAGTSVSPGSPTGTGTDVINTAVAVDPPKDIVFNVVEEMPAFIGGEAALFKYLKDNIRYPKIALENGIKGKVIMQFVVNTDGSIQDIKVMRGIGGGCDEEALNAIKKMPAWKPGRMNGRPVRVKYTLPVSFVSL
jgi:periplasmic protein TonB